MVEKESGHRIRTLRIDNGGEFKSNELMDYFRFHGIKI